MASNLNTIKSDTPGETNTHTKGIGATDRSEIIDANTNANTNPVADLADPNPQEGNILIRDEDDNNVPEAELCTFVTANGNQQFFVNATRARLIDTVFTNADTMPPGMGPCQPSIPSVLCLETLFPDFLAAGGITIGNGSTDLIFENCIVRNYTGTGQGLDVFAFLHHPPVLPRRPYLTFPFVLFES